MVLYKCLNDWGRSDLLSSKWDKTSQEELCAQVSKRNISVYSNNSSRQQNVFNDKSILVNCKNYNGITYENYFKKQKKSKNISKNQGKRNFLINKLLWPFRQKWLNRYW